MSKYKIFYGGEIPFVLGMQPPTWISSCCLILVAIILIIYIIISNKKEKRKNKLQQ